MLPDRLFYPLFLLVAGALIGLALVWPQGQGSPSPPPFGRPMAAPSAPIGKPILRRLGIQ
jgi:hypothetical protein